MKLKFMEKITLKLGEILQLESEINGFIDPQTQTQVFEGFTKQNLSIIMKYELTELCETLKAEKIKVETLRDELIKKHGEDDGMGGIRVLMYNEVTDENNNIISKTINPKYIEFDQEYGTLLNQDKEIEYPEITKDDLKEAGKSKDKYQILFKLIKK
jgi:hypothetical protein